MSTPVSTVYAQARTAAALAMVAGFVDAYGYITYQTYVSFMSGNTTQAGIRAGAGNVLAALPMLLAILFFIVGVAIGTLIVDGRASPSQHLALGVVASLLAFVIVVTGVRAVPSQLPIVVLTSAMGILNTTMSRIGAETVNLTFVSGTLGKIGHHLALAYAGVPLPDAQGDGDTHTRRVLLLAGLWVAFCGGALLAGAATPRYSNFTLMLPTVILLTLSVIGPRSIRPSYPAVTRTPDVLEDSHA